MSGGWLAITLGGTLAFAEAILGVGIVLPGEVMVTGITTTVAPEQRIALFVAVTLGATLGDHLNYWLGRLMGSRLSQSRLVDRIGRHHWDRAVALVRRHGAWAVVVSRLLPVVRTLMAAVAGVSMMSYRSFAVASLTGSVLWAAVWIGAGDTLGRIIANPVLILPVATVLVCVVILRARRRTRRARHGEAR